MSHSLFHAKSSNKLFDVPLKQSLPIHNWFDGTKAICATFRHRALRHHAQGIELCKQIFDDVSFNISDGLSVSILKTVTIDEIGRQHMKEDFGCLMDANKWWSEIELDSWMEKQVRFEASCKACVRKFGGQNSDYEFLYAFFAQFDTEDPRSRSLLWHSWGIFDAESVFGITFNRDSDEKELPTRTVAESIVLSAFQRIPSPEDWIKSIKEDKWMYFNAAQLSKDVTL
jgi:hypothetical protein